MLSFLSEWNFTCSVLPFSGVFEVFDENRDNHIDFKEMACGISACCRGPNTERQKCKFPLVITISMSYDNANDFITKHGSEDYT